MKPKQVAKEIIAEISTIKVEAVALKIAAEKFVKETLEKIKSKTGQVPDEAGFLEVVAEIINILVIEKYIPNPMRFIIIKLGLVLKILKLLDKHVLDKWFGKNWYFNISNYLR